jgi:predicted permease
MFWLRLIYSRLYGLLRRNRIEQEMEDEMRFHLLMRTRENIKRGMRPDEAEREARRRFGNVGRVKDLARDIKGGGFVETLLQDLRYGARMLLRHKGFTAVVALSLALGIGANTTLFSLADVFFWRALPAVNADGLFTLVRGDGMVWPTSYPDYVVYRDGAQSFAGLSAYEPVLLAFGNGERSRMVTGELVTGNFFEVLGARVSQGRAFLPEEDRTPGAHPVVVISHDFWLREFDGDPQLVGKTITLNNHSFTVIGVAAEGFAGISNPLRAVLWIPIMMEAAAKPNEKPGLNSRDIRQGMFAIGRLREGVSRAQAEAELNTINRQLLQAYPAPPDPESSWRGLPLSLSPAQGTLNSGVRRRMELVVKLVTILTGIVLLIACANVANLLLARAVARRKEIAIRLALGAGRMRLIRQLLTEGLLLALLAAAAGSLLAFWINRLLMSVQPGVLQHFELKVDLRLDGRALVFTLLLSMLTSVMSSLAPAWAATRPDVIPALKEESGTSGRRQSFSLRNSLIVAQLALSLALLINAGLVVRSLINEQAIDPGFDTSDGLLVTLDLGMLGYSKERGLEFYRQLAERLATAPGVRSAAIADSFPMSSDGEVRAPISIEGQPPPADGQPIIVPRQLVGLRYFETTGIPLLRGRDFTAQDTALSERVVIINETMARRYWPNLKEIGEVVGQRIRIGAGPEIRPNGLPNRLPNSLPNGLPNSLPDSLEDAHWSVIIGVAGDCRTRGWREKTPAGMLMPISQNYAPVFQALARSNAEEATTISALRREVAALDPNLPIKFITTVRERIGIQLWGARMFAGLTMALGLLGLLLAAIGLYGVISYAVAQRTREIGIRMALGAQARDLLKMIIGQGMRLTLAGVAVGLALALALARVIANMLYGVTSTDPVTFTGVTVFLMSVALLACYLPARRATKIDPMASLRLE